MFGLACRKILCLMCSKDLFLRILLAFATLPVINELGGLASYHFLHLLLDFLDESRGLLDLKTERSQSTRVDHSLHLRDVLFFQQASLKDCNFESLIDLSYHMMFHASVTKTLSHNIKKISRTKVTSHLSSLFKKEKINGEM